MAEITTDRYCSTGCGVAVELSGMMIRINSREGGSLEMPFVEFLQKLKPSEELIEEASLRRLQSSTKLLQVLKVAETVADKWRNEISQEEFNTLLWTLYEAVVQARLSDEWPLP